MEGSEHMIKMLAAETVIMPPSTADRLLLDFVTTTHLKHGHLSNLPSMTKSKSPHSWTVLL